MKTKTYALEDGRKYTLPLDGDYVVGCNGSETPITWNGKHYIYMWSKVTSTHDYYCLEDDMSLPRAPWEG